MAKLTKLNTIISIYRCSMTLTPHPDKDELIMFGGEYFTGNQVLFAVPLPAHNVCLLHDFVATLRLSALPSALYFVLSMLAL